MARIYKGSDKCIVIPIKACLVEELTKIEITFYTDGSTSFAKIWNVEEKNNTDIIIKDDKVLVFCYAPEFEFLVDGQLKYKLEYQYVKEDFPELYDVTMDVETEFFVKTGFDPGAASGMTIEIRENGTKKVKTELGFEITIITEVPVPEKVSELENDVPYVSQDEINGMVKSDSTTSIVFLTKEEYDAIETKDSKTMYCIKAF